MNTRALALLPLVGLSMSAPLFIAGCDGDEDPGCDTDHPCVEVGTIRSSALTVTLSPDGEGHTEVSLFATLPPVPGNLCYRAPSDLTVSANGGPPRPIGVGHETGDAIILFSTDCHLDQWAGATVTVPSTSEPITITFARGETRASLTVTPVNQPAVDVTLSSNAVNRGVPFSADLQVNGGALPTAAGCWTAELLWDSLERSMTLKTTPEPLPSGVRLGFAFSDDVPASELSPGGAQLILSPVASAACNTVPAVSCPSFQRCTASQAARVLGPYHLDLI